MILTSAENQSVPLSCGNTATQTHIMFIYMRFRKRIREIGKKNKSEAFAKYDFTFKTPLSTDSFLFSGISLV